ncbi:MAG: hypothetical protein Aurels2KO_57730 [Aureliella sp.]
MIVVPIAVALISAWHAHEKRSYQTWAYDVYRTGVERGSDASPALLFKAFGKSKCVEIMLQHADATKDIAFDGQDRWLQILRVPFAHGQDMGDGYTLYSLGTLASTGWTLPKGVVIKSATFDKDEVVFYVAGKIEQGSYRYVIPDDDPDEFRITWPAGTPAPGADLHAMMYRKYCVPANHAP